MQDDKLTAPFQTPDVALETKDNSDSNPTSSNGRPLDSKIAEDNSNKAESVLSTRSEDRHFLHGNESEEDLPAPLLLALGQVVSNLCSVCREFPKGRIAIKFKDEELHTDLRPYHHSISSLRRSVNSGCYLCESLLQSFDEFVDESEMRAGVSDDCSIQCMMKVADDIKSTGHEISLLFYLFGSEGHQVTSVRRGLPYARPELLASMTFNSINNWKSSLGPEFFQDPAPKRTSAKSATSMELARNWYEQCSRNHTTCRTWKLDSRILPTRLLRVWKPHDSHVVSAKLCLATDLPASTSYTTLSHCWGNGDFLKTTSVNYQVFQKEVPVYELPSTFKDAMHVTFELGIQYIWIDSLCIIQDSKEDWTNESKMMGDVYRYAACNIAATGYQNGETGLFSERPLLPFANRLWHVDCLLFDDTRPNWKLREVRFNGFYMDIDLIDYQKSIPFNDLNSRAWVAQERALSPGIIHYTPGKIWWECNQLIANETFPLGDCAEWYQGLDHPEGNIRSLKKDDEESVYSFWRDFTNHYAGTHITFEKDRLAATAGLAHTVGELLDDNFVAGFWEKDLINSLLWTPKRHALRKIRGFPTKQLVPSWSWASVCGELETWTYSLKPKSNTTDTKLSFVSLGVLSDTVGFESDIQLDSLETSAARGLAIRAPLRTVSTDMLASTGFWRTYKSKSVSSFSSWQDKKSLSPELVENIPHDQAWRLKDSTHLLPLKKTWSHKGIVGLLLQFVPGAEDQATFRRSGCFHISFRTTDERNIHECFGLLEQNGVCQPGSMFEECGLQDIVLV